jgi:hypothetical protein
LKEIAMEQKQIPDLTYNDLVAGIPEDFKEKFKELIVILLAQMLEMNKAESESFIKVWSRLLCIQAKVLAKAEAAAMMSGEKGWTC